MKPLSPISIWGKYLDQPKLVGKFSKAVPAMLIGGGLGVATAHIYNSPKQEKRKEAIKSMTVLTGTIGTAFVATRGMKAIKIGGKTIFKGFKGLTEKIDLEELKEKNTKLIQEFLEENKVTQDTEEILNRAKSKILSYDEIKTMYKELHTNPKAKDFLNGEDGLIPSPEIIDSKEIFSEIKRLSIMGLVPVLGGIAGGIAGDKLTEKNWKERIPDKIKEGSYQYLANIFLCNIGAGAALWAMEKAKITSKAVRAAGMIGGIIALGIIGGSAIANLIGKTCIDPLFKHKHANRHGHGHGHHRLHGHRKSKQEKLYNERTPEILDVSLHVDDVSTVAVLSGLKWIEPALPVMYSISGYRAGIGYRNGEKTLKKN